MRGAAGAYPDSGRQRAGARAARWALAAAIVGSAFAIGTVHTITLTIVTFVLGAAAVLAWWSSDPIAVRPAATLLLFAGLGLELYTVWQCLPMPAGLIDAIAPANADVWARALAAFHEPGPRWATITLDPPATRIEVVRGAAYLLAFVAALRISQRREGLAFLGQVIVATGVLLALAALLHPAFGARKLFGVYEPGPGIAESHIAPLMNPNNLAGYLNVAFCLALATCLSPEPAVPRAIAVALMLFLGASQVWVASRGGVISMVLGGATVVALSFGDRIRRRDPGTWLTVACGGAMLVGGFCIVLASSTKAQGELLDPELSKFELLREVWRMVPDHWAFGVGRGAFESVFPHYRLQPGHTSFTNPENLLAQWATEWGMPVTVLGLVALALALRPTAALARSRKAAGAWAALAAIAVQNLADFSSEVPGVMITVAVCAANVVAGSAGLGPKWRAERWARAPRAVAWVAGLGAITAAAVGVSALGRHLHEDRRRLYDAAAVHVASAEGMRDLARQAILRHPAEPYFPFAVALRAMRAQDESPLPWLGATLERAPVYGAAHLLLARFLTPRSVSQARLEYRLAYAETPEIGVMVGQEAQRLVGSHDDAMELVPDGPSGEMMLDWLVLGLANRLPATSVRLGQELVRREPAALLAYQRAAAAAESDLRSGDETSWCQGEARARCIDDARRLATRFQAADPAACEGYALEAGALAAAGHSAEALAILERATDRVSDRVTCLQALAALARDSHDERRLEIALGQVVRAGCSEKSQCVDRLVWVAGMQEASGSPRRALVTYKQAYAQSPEHDGVLEQMARLAKVAGLNAEALEDYQELARRHPTDGRWATAVQEERDAMSRGALPF